jgi:Fic family protein
MQRALDQLEKFIHHPGKVPILIQCGLVHCQFETLHPFLDGNGRIGRLLITFLLYQMKVLRYPLLYLSHYFKNNKQEYYNRLMAVRNEGNWEQWIEFFLKGVLEVSRQAQETSQAIINYEKEQRKILSQKFSPSSLTMNLWNQLLEHPIINSQKVQELLGCSQATAIKCLTQLADLKILEETTGSRRYRVYQFSPYLKLFE